VKQNKSAAIPIWDRPINFNPNEFEGQQAFLAGQDIGANPYGESSAAKDWTRGWKAEEAKAEKTKTNA